MPEREQGTEGDDRSKDADGHPPGGPDPNAEGEELPKRGSESKPSPCRPESLATWSRGMLYELPRDDPAQDHAQRDPNPPANDEKEQALHGAAVTSSGIGWSSARGFKTWKKQDRSAQAP